MKISLNLKGLCEHDWHPEVLIIFLGGCKAVFPSLEETSPHPLSAPRKFESKPGIEFSIKRKRMKRKIKIHWFNLQLISISFKVLLSLARPSGLRLPLAVAPEKKRAVQIEAFNKASIRLNLANLLGKFLGIQFQISTLYAWCLTGVFC